MGPSDLWRGVASHAGDSIPEVSPSRAASPSSEVWILLCGGLLQASGNPTFIYQFHVISMFPSSFFRSLIPVERTPHMNISLLKFILFS